MSATLRQDTEHGPRIERLTRLVEERGLDAVVMCTHENVCYFSGADIQSQLLLPTRLAFMVARRDGAPSLLLCNIEESQARSDSPIEDVRSYVEFAEDPAAALAAIL